MGRGRRRTWRKLHLGVDEKTKDIVAVDLTTSAVHDSPHMPDVLDLVHDPVHQVSGDRAYDTGTCYQAILARGAVPTIPPRRNARLSTAKDPPPFRVERDAVIRRIKEDGPYPWRTSSGATRQSLAENAVSRFKALVGVKLTARIFENQQVEARVKCRRLLTLRHRPIPLTGGPVRDRPAGELQTSVRTNNSESYGTRDRRTCHVARRSVASGHRLVAQPATVGPAVLRVRLRTAIRMARSKQGVAPRLTQ